MAINCDQQAPAPLYLSRSLPVSVKYAHCLHNSCLQCSCVQKDSKPSRDLSDLRIASPHLLFATRPSQSNYAAIQLRPTQCEGGHGAWGTLLLRVYFIQYIRLCVPQNDDSSLEACRVHLIVTRTKSDISACCRFPPVSSKLSCLAYVPAAQTPHL